jgi:hypothetical protein
VPAQAQDRRQRGPKPTQWDGGDASDDAASTGSAGPLLIPADRVKRIVEAWIAAHETPERAFLALEAGSAYKADTWRKRLSLASGDGLESSRGWWAHTHIDACDVDEFLTAADLPHLWHAELSDLLPA